MKSRLLLPLLLLLAACAEPGAIAPGSAPLAVDLGGSSRVPRIAGRVGEGEGYDAAQQPMQPTRQTPTASVTPRTPNASMPASGQGAVDHSKMDHSQMDHTGSTKPTTGEP